MKFSFSFNGEKNWCLTITPSISRRSLVSVPLRAERNGAIRKIGQKQSGAPLPPPIYLVTKSVIYLVTKSQSNELETVNKKLKEASKDMRELEEQLEEKDNLFLSPYLPPLPLSPHLSAPTSLPLPLSPHTAQPLYHSAPTFQPLPLSRPPFSFPPAFQ